MTAPVVRHNFTSNVADANTNGIIKPSHWNDAHAILVDTGILVGRASPMSGSAENVHPLSGDLELYLDGATARLRLAGTGVTAGAYTVPNITVDAKGRVTAIENGPNLGSYVSQAQAAQAAAEAAQAAAESARDDTLEALDDFDDVYLGSKAADPTLDNDGDPLVEGQLYWNSVANELRVYDGAAWQAYSPTSGITAVVDDATPQLGGHLDLNNFNITGTGNIDITGAGAFSGDVTVPDEAYGSGWNASLEVPTKNAVYDKVEAVVSDLNAHIGDASDAHDASAISVVDSGGFYTGTDVEAALQEIGQDIAALDQAVVLKGTWDASGGSFPGSGAAQAGWSYIVSVGGTVDGVAFVANDRILAITDNASTSTYSGNWHKLDYTDQVLSVAGKTGAVTLAQADIGGLTTADNPQFAGVNLSHATANTLTGSGGDAFIEGNRLFRVGGADVPVADGGTGASDASGARTNLGLGTSDSPTFTNQALSGYLDFSEIATPANPSANIARVYSKDSAGTTKLYMRDSAGTETEFGAGGGAASAVYNAIINGAMMVAQRGTSFTSTTTPANSDDTFLLDRWILLSDGNDTVDVTQSTEAPTNGLNSIALDVETVNRKFGILQVIEQKNCIGLIGETCTLKFQAKVSSTTKLDNLKAAIIAWDGTADSVTSDIVSAWGVEGTNPTLVANWTYENTPANLTPTTSWASYSVSAAIDTASTKNIGVFIWSDVTDTTLGDFLYITDVQLVKGASAGDFPRRSFNEELGLCKRYYEKSFNYATAPAQNAGQSGAHSWGQTASGASAADHAPSVKFAVTKFTTPTITTYSPSGASAQIFNTNTSGHASNTTANNIGTEGFGINFTSAGSSAQAHRNMLHWQAVAEL